MIRKTLWMALGGVAVALVGFGYFAYSVSAENADPPPVNPGFTVTAADHTLGNPKAKVTLIEYAAPICPHCAHFNANIFPQLKKAYIDTGKVFYVFRVYPIMPEDGAAEKLARCLPKAKYFAFMDQLFRNQPQWDPEYRVADTRTALLAQAEKAGIPAPQASQCVASTKEDASINRTAAEAEQRYRINSTPSFVLDGLLQQAPEDRGWTFENMAKMLDRELSAKS